jgi:hypothetical protein
MTTADPRRRSGRPATCSDSTVTEIAQVKEITKPLIYNTRRAGGERGELDRAALPGGQQAFKVRKQAPASDAAPVS